MARKRKAPGKKKGPCSKCGRLPKLAEDEERIAESTRSWQRVTTRQRKLCQASFLESVNRLLAELESRPDADASWGLLELKSKLERDMSV